MHAMSINIIAIVVLAAALAACHPPQFQLESAILRGDIALIESLLDDPTVDINWSAPVGGGALHTAASYRQPQQEQIARLLLRRGADPNVANADNMTPLHLAAYEGYESIVRVLIDAGANVNAVETRHGYTPLSAAAQTGHAQVIKLLLDAGADRDIQAVDGRKPFSVARQFGHMESQNALMSYQPSIATEPH